MKNLLYPLLATLFAIGISACSDGDGSSDSGLDAGSDADVTTDTDGSGDTGADADADTGDVVSCDDGGCAEGFICVEGVCESLSCLGPSDWVKCSELFDRIEPDRGRYATCTDQTCRESCLLDTDCPNDQICTDFGQCLSFDGDLSVEHPHGPAAGDLQAGVSNGLLNYPIGVPLGGYGERAALDDGRYAESLKATAGQFHGLYGRAVVLDNGERQLMIIRLPLIFTQMALHEEVARALQERTGDNWRDSLIISSTHTHSGPCRHWHLPIEAAAPLGSFGIGEFHQQFYDWLRDRVIELAMEALDDLAPAEIGWEIIEAYDTDDHVGIDRWDQSPPFDDNRALFIRVNDLDGVPRAVLFSYGAHGTANTSDYLTGDGIGMSERAYEAKLGETYGHYIPAFFVNQNSGTMGPAGGSIGHSFPMSMERMGWAFVDQTWDRFMDIETTREMTLDSNNIRFPLSYDLLGYDRGQFASDFNRPFGGEYHYGGLSCVGQYGGDDDYATHQVLEGLSCAGALHFLLFNAPPTTLTRSQMMTVALNGLTIAVVPGELSMELSWEMIRMLRDTYGVDPLEAWTFGYANDHLFYLLPDNLRGELPPYPGISTPQPLDDYPDYAFSFLQGGYESTMSMWGPFQGDYLLERLSETYHQMLDSDYELSLDEVAPSQYARRDDPPFAHQTTPDDVIGTFSAQPPATVERLSIVEFSWFGGDPAAEMPQVPVVTLERFADDAWETVSTPSTLPYDNLLPLFVTRVRQETDDSDWEWVVRWEELTTFPTGTYRFHINGHYFDESDARQPYELYTDEFEFVPTDDIIVTADVAEGAVTGTVGFPSEERGRYRGPSSDPGRAEGNFRMRHPMVPTGLASPVESLDSVTVSLFDGDEAVGTNDTATEIDTADGVVDGRTIPVTSFEIALPEVASGTYTMVIEVSDTHGNTGTYSTEITL